MAMQCAISGQTPEEPVISKKSGHIYEKRLVHKYIDAEGKCPATGEELSLDDLLELRTDKAVKPRPIEAASIPGLLAIMQNEWDDVMLETHTLKHHLDQTRQELSQALYQNDAACRVIARLVRERDEARSQMQAQKIALAQTKAAAAPAAAAPAEEMQVDEEKEEGISEAVLDKMHAKNNELSKKRKKRIIPVDLTTPETISSWDPVAKQHTLHKTTPAGVTCLDLHPSKPNLVITGGVDKTAIVFDRNTQAQVVTLAGHTKRVTDVCFHPSKDLAITSSADKTARVWQAQEDGSAYSIAHVLDDHEGEVVGATVHATGDFLSTASKDKSWAFYDINRGRLLKHVKSPDFVGGNRCVRFHPDGLILGTGTTDSFVRIWDMKQAVNVANFEHQGGGAVNALAFSENGYYMASACEDGFARLWDLRKLNNFRKLPIGTGAASSVAFDFSGSYLAVGGKSCAKVFAVKSWNELASYDDFGGTVTGVQFGTLAGFLATSSMDRTVRFYGK